MAVYADLTLRIIIMTILTGIYINLIILIIHTRYIIIPRPLLFIIIYFSDQNDNSRMDSILS